MSSRINLLGAVLALQLVLVGVVLFADMAGEGSGQSTFLQGDPASVSTFEIFDSEGRSVRLERGADGWMVSAPADAQDSSPAPLAADGAKVSEALDKLMGQRAQWPVGTTAETRERFEVTEAAFQRKLVLVDSAGARTEVYLGTSPGYRRVHARRADADEVYSIDFANYQVPAELDEWIDKTLLAARGSISEVVREGAWTLARDGEGWLVDGRAADPDAAAELVRRLDDLRIIGVVPAAEAPPAEAAPPSETAPPEEGEDGPVAVFSISDDDGTYVLRLFGGAEEAEYRLTSDRLEGRFRVAAYVAEQLLVDVDDLVTETNEAEAAGAPAADQ